jgi:hypothetical protein
VTCSVTRAPPPRAASAASSLAFRSSAPSSAALRGARGPEISRAPVSRSRRRSLRATPRAAIAVPAAAATAAGTSAALSAASSAATSAATTAATTAGGSFWGYFLSFIFGGVFFSTALGIAALFISVGSENIRRAWRVFQFLSSRVLALVSQTFAAVRESLSDEKETLADTRKVLADGFAATKREVDESLRAFNQERDFYAAAVGIPGLRTAQYLIDHMMPGLIAAKLEQSLAQSISNATHPNVKKMILKSVAAGKAAPLLTGARFYDVGETAMAFDVDVKWISDINANMDVVPAMGLPAEGLARVPVCVHDVKFDGTVRVLMAGLSRQDPGYGAVVVSFPDPPSIALDVRVGGGLEVNRVPWLRKVVSDATKTWIKDEMLWPRRMLIPAERPPSVPGGKPENVLSDAELEAVLAEDPLMMAEEQLMSLQEIATGEVGTKTARGVDAAGDGAPDDAEPSNDGEFDLDVEVTDPDHPRPVPPKKTAREQAWAWLSGATRATVDKTLEVSKYAADTGVEIAKSEETRRALDAVASTPRVVGSWWEKDAKGWINNVTSRATGRGAQKDKNGFPSAAMWTNPPEEEKKTDEDASEDASDAEEGRGAKKNGAAPGAVDGTTAPQPRDKKKPEM